MCLDLCPLDALIFFSICIALWLSWHRLLSFIVYSCPSKKYLVHNICGSIPLVTISSVSIELFQFSFYFEDLLNKDPLPNDNKLSV